MHPPAVDAALYLITGIQAAGKSTVAQALAERLPGPSVHVHGDQFRRWIVNGRLDMTPDAGPGAVDQLRLRHQLTADACDRYREAGFSVVAQDVVLGPHLQFVIDLIRSRPLYVVVLALGQRSSPSVNVGARRTATNAGRSTFSTADCATTPRDWACGSTPLNSRPGRPSTRSCPGCRKHCSRADQEIVLRHGRPTPGPPPMLSPFQAASGSSRRQVNPSATTGAARGMGYPTVVVRSGVGLNEAHSNGCCRLEDQLAD